MIPKTQKSQKLNEELCAASKRPFPEFESGSTSQNSPGERRLVIAEIGIAFHQPARPLLPCFSSAGDGLPDAATNFRTLERPNLHDRATRKGGLLGESVSLRLPPPERTQSPSVGPKASGSNIDFHNGAYLSALPKAFKDQILHKRGSSDSSVASAGGPPSPLSHNTVHPHIATSDFSYPAYNDFDFPMPQTAKSIPTTQDLSSMFPRANPYGTVDMRVHSPGADRIQPDSHPQPTNQSGKARLLARAQAQTSPLHSQATPSKVDRMKTANASRKAVDLPSETPVSGAECDQDLRQDPPEGDSTMLLQPDTRPITAEQIVNDVKGIYSGLVMVEKKCVEIIAQRSSTGGKLSNDQWQALIALHRTLLHEHHDFFLASQHSTASPALRRLATKYAMPARMWRNGIHAEFMPSSSSSNSNCLILMTICSLLSTSHIQ